MAGRGGGFQARALPGRRLEIVARGAVAAVGVVRLNLNEKGDLLDIDWMRPPTHAPEVVAEIERTVRAASPFPAPKRLGPVVYTETWLWDKSGRFQLDTLTEGQSWTQPKGLS